MLQLLRTTGKTHVIIQSCFNNVQTTTNFHTFSWSENKVSVQSIIIILVTTGIIPCSNWVGEIPNSNPRRLVMSATPTAQLAISKCRQSWQSSKRITIARWANSGDKMSHQLMRRSVLSLWLCLTHLSCRWSIASREHVPYLSSHGSLFVGDIPKTLWRFQN